jgi:hypothetical protein
MPVLECSCGMVMSVTAAKPRNTCIRCGGVEFRELERLIPVKKANECASLLPVTICGNTFSMQPLPSAGTAVGPILAR